MPFVQAKCQNCGGILAVDDSLEAAICPFCNMPYVVEKAINNYNITNNFNIGNAVVNVAGVDIDNLLKRAQQFEQEGDIKKAFEYYNKVLDIDINNEIAKNALNKRIGKYKVTTSQKEEIDKNLKAGNKLAAIKILLQITGDGLAETSAAINEYLTSL